MTKLQTFSPQSVDLLQPAFLRGMLTDLQKIERELEERLSRLRHLEEVRRDADRIREECSTLAGFLKHAWHVLEPSTDLVWSWHLDAICEHLEAISREQLKPRLITNVPPGSSKSTLVSIMWQAWEWGPFGKPGNRFLSTSYEIGNVTRDTRKTRDLVMSEWYQALWPLKMKRAGETSFENEHRGTREGVAFGSLTAKRGDRLTIDDPHSLDGAESEVERSKAVRRFLEGGQNRLNNQEKSAIVIVMQRLHEADLTGALLAREAGYEHLMLPMEFEIERRCVTSIFKDPRVKDGEILDPVRFGPGAIDELKIDNDYSWAGQYQQRPAPREGGMFKVDQIEIVDSVPAGAKRVRGWDIAGSTRKTSPYTVGARLALAGPVLYIDDVVRARVSIDRAEKLIVDTAHEDGRTIKQSVPQDPGSSGKSQKMHISNRLAGLEFLFSTETGSKEDRAIPFASMVNAGNVRMVKASWNVPLIEEMRNFPGSTYKDQIDALSRAFEQIAKLMGEKKRTIAAPIYGTVEDDR